jgi:hypothetical protein
MGQRVCEGEKWRVMESNGEEWGGMERNGDRRRGGENARDGNAEEELEGAARSISGMTCGAKSHRKFTVEED